jgi:hypothetical protein
MSLQTAIAPTDFESLRLNYHELIKDNLQTFVKVFRSVGVYFCLHDNTDNLNKNFVMIMALTPPEMKKLISNFWCKTMIIENY